MRFSAHLVPWAVSLKLILLDFTVGFANFIETLLQASISNSLDTFQEA